MNTDQYIWPIFLAGSLVLVLFAFFLVFYVVIQKNKQNRFAFEKQKIRQEVNESTMNQISLEIHDSIGQILFLAEMNASSLSNIVKDEKAKQLINETGDLVRQAMSDLRHISHSLNNEQIKKLGLVETLTRSIHYIHQSNAPRCYIDIIGDQVRLPAEKELMIFRIAQEALSNALKHSKATKVVITLNYTERKLRLIIQDNGIGFDLINMPDSGVGIMNMSQRAKVLDGELNIESNHGGGCMLMLTVGT